MYSHLYCLFIVIEIIFISVEYYENIIKRRCNMNSNIDISLLSMSNISLGVSSFPKFLMHINSLVFIHSDRSHYFEQV